MGGRCRFFWDPAFSCCASLCRCSLCLLLRHRRVLARGVSREREDARFETRSCGSSGACMSPSSLCAATVQPPAQTGMNAQSLHCSQAASCSKLRSACVRIVFRRPSMWPVDCSASPAKPGQAKSEPSGPMVCACDLWISHGPMWTPSAVREAALLRLFAQERHLLVDEVARCRTTRLDAGAGRCHARAVQRLAVGSDDGERDDAFAGDLRSSRG